jgi:hypothetical protein
MEFWRRRPLKLGDERINTIRRCRFWFSRLERKTPRVDVERADNPGWLGGAPWHHEGDAPGVAATDWREALRRHVVGG